MYVTPGITLEYYLEKGKNEHLSQYYLMKELDTRYEVDVFDDVGSGYKKFIDTLSQEELRKVCRKELMFHHNGDKRELISTETLINKT